MQVSLGEAVEARVQQVHASQQDLHEEPSEDGVCVVIKLLVTRGYSNVAVYS